MREKQVVDLPLNGRNFTKLLELTPGVAPVSVSQNGGGFTARPIGQFQFPAVNGQTNRSNLFMLDGVFNQGAFVSTYAVPPIIDTIQEFKVNAHNDDPEFGGALGGIVNVVTKGGTNQFRGNAWWFLRNEKLDSRNFFRRQVTPQKWNQFGGTLGGPVVRNKTFFMLGYQGLRLRRPSDSLLRVPPQTNLGGDLSDDPRKIYNPFRTRATADGGFERDPFQNNRIPQRLLSPTALAFAQALLPSAGPVITSDRNALDSTPVRQNQEEYTARLDHVFNERDSVWFRWSGTLQDNDVSGGLPSLGGFQEYRARNTAASWVHTFSPTTIFQLQGGWVKSIDNAGNRFGDRGVLAQLACASTFCGSFNSGEDLIPSYNVTGWFSGGESNSLNTPPSSIINFRSNVTKVMGNHTIKFGGEGNTTDFQAYYENLNQAFRVQQTANPLDNDGGISLASFLIGAPDSAGRRNVWETLRPGGTVGFYLMDSWKATPRLAINLGLRYDRQFQPPYGEEKTIGKQGGIETGALDLLRGIYVLQRVPPSCAERGFAPCIPTPDGSLPEHVVSDPRGKVYHDTTKNFQPRVGIAFRVSDRTVLRTSYGIFFDEWAAVTQTAQNYEGGWPDVGQQLGNNLNQPTEASALPTIDITSPFPQGAVPAADAVHRRAVVHGPAFREPPLAAMELRPAAPAGRVHGGDRELRGFRQQPSQRGRLLQHGHRARARTDQASHVAPARPAELLRPQLGQAQLSRLPVPAGQDAVVGPGVQGRLHVVPVHGPWIVGLVRGRGLRCPESLQSPGGLLTLGIRHPPRADGELDLAASLGEWPKDRPG